MTDLSPIDLAPAGPAAADRPAARCPRPWLAAVIAATAAPGSVPPLPFQRGSRRRPVALACPAALAAE